MADNIFGTYRVSTNYTCIYSPELTPRISATGGHYVEASAAPGNSSSTQQFILTVNPKRGVMVSSEGRGRRTDLNRTGGYVVYDLTNHQVNESFQVDRATDTLLSTSYRTTSVTPFGSVWLLEAPAGRRFRTNDNGNTFHASLSDSPVILTQTITSGGSVSTLKVFCTGTYQAERISKSY